MIELLRAIEAFWSKGAWAQGIVWMVMLAAAYTGLTAGVPVWPAYAALGVALISFSPSCNRHWFERVEFIAVSSAALGFGAGRMVRAMWPQEEAMRLLLFNFAHWSFCVFCAIYLVRRTAAFRKVYGDA